MPPEIPELSDNQIATHEAGHALVGHLMGEEIDLVRMHAGRQSAFIRPVNWPPTRTSIVAGQSAEFLCGMTIYPQRAAKDNHIAAGLPDDEGTPSPLRMLRAHLDTFNDLRAWFGRARTERRDIPGGEVHAFLEERDCIFGAGDPGLSAHSKPVPAPPPEPPTR